MADTATHPQTSSSDADESARNRRHPVLRKVAAALLWVILALGSLWCVAALYYDVRMPGLRAPLAIFYAVAVLAAFVMVKRRALAKGIVAGAFCLVLVWWLMLRPSNDREWLPDLAILPYAEVAGNRVTVHNIRNCDYRSETDFDVRHYDKTFDLDKLRTAELYMVYWGSPHMAHTMATFGFDGGDYVCFSIETRKEKGEGYSAVKGLFRQFELTYVVADERDLVRLRTNYRQGEEAYLYQVRMTPEQARRLFLDYLNRANALKARAEWYNALTDNCTTAIRTQRAASDRSPWNWRMLVNGHLDELLYERGMIATNLPFAEVKKLCHINARAKAADKAADFSKLIREGLPTVNP
jgi:hypothetical protein